MTSNPDAVFDAAAAVATAVTSTRYLVWDIDKGGWWHKSRHGYTQILATAAHFREAEAEEIIHRSALDNYPHGPRAVMVPVPDGNRYQAKDTTAVLDMAAEALTACLLISELGHLRLAEAFTDATTATDPWERATVLRAIMLVCVEEAYRLELAAVRAAAAKGWTE